MTTIHPTLTPWLAGLRGLGRPASRSGPGGFGLFFKPSADGFTRHSKRAFQPAQGATFFVGVENPRFFGVTVTGCRGIFAAHTLAVATPEPLFLIAREPVTNKLFAFTKPAFECDCNHKQDCARSNLTYPLPLPRGLRSGVRRCGVQHPLQVAQLMRQTQLKDLRRRFQLGAKTIAHLDFCPRLVHHCGDDRRAATRREMMID